MQCFLIPISCTTGKQDLRKPRRADWKTRRRVPTEQPPESVKRIPSYEGEKVCGLRAQLNRGSRTPGHTSDFSTSATMDRHGCSKTLPACAAESYLSSPKRPNRESPSPRPFPSARSVSETPHRLAQWQRRGVGNLQRVAFCVSAPTDIHWSVVAKWNNNQKQTSC